MVDQVHALLLIQATYVGNDGAVRPAYPESVSECPFVLVFVPMYPLWLVSWLR
jgi:hypothetical protein